MTRYQILAMDGGGIRGILTARILERLDKLRPGFLANTALFAGTSTGGLLALGFSSGMTAAQMRRMYEELAGVIFADSLWDNIHDLGNLVGAQYANEPLKRVLTEYFANATLDSLSRKVLISSFQLDNQGQSAGGIRSWKMKFFQNYPGPGSDGGELVVDVAMRTAVAPSYFPIYQGYIDGGVAAGNPAMCALAQALAPNGGAQALNTISLLSLGTGYNPHYLNAINNDWGLAQWAPHMLNIMLEGSINVVDYQCRQILDERYLRINPPLPVPIEMDSIDKLPQLLETADNVPLDPVLAWIDSYFV